MRSGPALAALLVAGSLTGCGTGSTSPSTATAPSTAPSTTTSDAQVSDVDVGGGRTISIVCAGPADTGRPIIVFENGAGPTMSTWSRVVQEIIVTERACTYDRAGTGGSDAATGQRTTRDQVADLASALDGAGVAGPIVLVAHSRGGWNATVYTAEHPGQVAGLVLVDVEPPGLDAAWLAELPPEAPGEHPDIAEARGILTDHSNDPSVTAELLDLEASQEQVEAAPGFGARPVEILWATETAATEWPAGFDADLVARLNGVFEDLRAGIEALAVDANVTRVDSDHAIQEEQPAAVVDAIYRVLTEVR